jgi:hypothetical protein
VSTVPAEKLRAWYSHRQGLDGRLAGATAAEVLTETGWARSVGGTGPYLTLFSRAGISREAADAAVAKLQIHELPAARGCTYVLPSQDFALALEGRREFSGSEMKVGAEAGRDEKESTIVRRGVKRWPKGDASEAPDRDSRRGGNAARAWARKGKKKGIDARCRWRSGMLQSVGEIRRVPVNGRLDQQRYKYALWVRIRWAKFKMSVDEVSVELARRYFAVDRSRRLWISFSGSLRSGREGVQGRVRAAEAGALAAWRQSNDAARSSRRSSRRSRFPSRRTTRSPAASTAYRCCGAT